METSIPASESLHGDMGQAGPGARFINNARYSECIRSALHSPQWQKWITLACRRAGRVLQAVSGWIRNMDVGSRA